jgi:murein L,D-transpeptidase YafK
MKTLTALLFSLLLILSVFAEDTDKPPLEGVGPYKVDEVRVYKAKRKIEIWYQGEIVKTYYPHLGRGGLKPKQREGDLLVPEGKYFLDAKNPYSKFYKSLHISYPNEEDIRRAKAAGVDPGKDIMLHGYPNNPIARMIAKRKVDWTQGCIAVQDWEMEEIYNSIEVPTPITIFP